jgi:hypothetical protein
MKEQRLIELLFEVKQGDKSPNQAWKEIMNLFNNGVLDGVSNCDHHYMRAINARSKHNHCVKCGKKHE